MKKCNSCGAMVADDSRFCSECGSSDIVPIPEGPAAQQPTDVPPQQPTYTATQPGPATQAQFYGQTGGASAPQQPPYPAGGYGQTNTQVNNGAQGYYPQANSQPGYGAPTGSYPPAGNAVPPAGGSYQQQPGAYPYAAGQPNYTPAAPVKKKKKTGLIIAIVLGVIFILGAVILFVGARLVKKSLEEFDPNEYIDELISEFEDGIVDNTTPAIPYTKGELVGNVYTNEWAGIRFTLPEGFINGSEEDYDDSDDIFTDACLVAEDDDDNGISFLTEEKGGYSGMTEDDFLADLTEDALDEEMISDGWSCGDVYSMEIAGETYRAVKISHSLTSAVEEIIACRIYDDHMLCFICYGDTDIIDGFFDSITAP